MHFVERFQFSARLVVKADGETRRSISLPGNEDVLVFGL
jgi:hypothetical protein